MPDLPPSRVREGGSQVTLIGHDAQVAAFRDALGGERMHHAWLLAGPKGLGKGLFARAAALRLLTEAAGPGRGWNRLDVPADHRIAALVAAGSHPDLRILERLPREKGEGLARSVTVDQIRGLARLFAVTPSLSPARVVIVDAADDLERGAANALLKSLEEPPPGTVFFLISHAPGRLLPTIRSRCRTLRFGALDDRQVARILTTAVPDADEGEIRALVGLSEGAPGRGLRFAGLDIAAIDAALDRLGTEGDATNAVRAGLAKSLALAAAQPRYEAFLERVPAHIATMARHRSGPALAAALKQWERARGIAEAARALSQSPESVVFELGGLVAALAPVGENA